jgi:hypothetical protein
MKPQTFTAIQSKIGPVLRTGAPLLLGLPVVTSISSPQQITLLDAGDVALADFGNFDEIAVSQQGLVEMETTPAAGEQSPPSTQSVLKSLWQNNLFSVKIVRFINYALGHSTSAVTMTTSYWERR